MSTTTARFKRNKGDLRLKNRFPWWYFILVTSPRDLWWQIHLTLKSTFYYVTHNATYIPVMYRREYNSLSLTNHVINQDFFTLLVSDPERLGPTGRQKQEQTDARVTWRELNLVFELQWGKHCQSIIDKPNKIFWNVL